MKQNIHELTNLQKTQEMQKTHKQLTQRKSPDREKGTGVPFDRHNADHVNMAKGLYYAWYGPKDAKLYMGDQGIDITTGQLNRLFCALRAEMTQRADRSALIQQYIHSTIET